MKSREMDRSAIEGTLVSNDPSRGGKSAVGGGGPMGFEAPEADVLEDASGRDRALTDDGVLSQDEAFSEFTPVELREFLAADHLESHADPGFKERLRKRLWNFIRERYGSGSSSSNSSSSR